MYEGCSYVTHDPGPLDDEDFHDYTEVPDLDGLPGSFHSNSSGYHSNGSSVQSRHHLPGSLERYYILYYNLLDLVSVYYKWYYK